MQPPSIKTQDRDVAILRGLFESRIMTSAHIAALYFDGSKEAAKQRLRKIKKAGLIGERPRRASEPAVLSLTRKAFDLLRGRGVLAEYPQIPSSALGKRASVSALTIHHELEVMDVKAGFHSAIRKTDRFTVAEFSTWPLLHQFRTLRPGHETEILAKPDGFIRIHETESGGGLSEHTFFLEVDRSTETQETLVKRSSCYLDYYKSGGFAVANGRPRSAYKEFPFRVLLVLKSAERRNNTAQRLFESNPPIRTLVYLATLKEVLADPVGTTWIRPVDYAEARKSDAKQRLL